MAKWDRKDEKKKRGKKKKRKVGGGSEGEGVDGWLGRKLDARFRNAFTH